MTSRWPFLLALAALFAVPARAQQPASSAVPVSVTPEEAAAPPPTAPVIVDGVTLFSVRGLSAYPPDRRAREIADRITAVAADRSVSIDSLVIVDLPEFSEIRAGGTRVMGVLDADARLEGVRRSTLARAALSAIRNAILAYRHDREAAVLAMAGLRALGAVLALAAALLLARGIRRRVHATVEARFRSRVRDFEIHSFQIVRAERLWRTAAGVLAVAWAAFAVVAVYLCLQYVLTLFPWTRVLGVGLGGMVAVPVEFFVDGLVALVPKLIFLAILAVVTKYVLRIIRLFFDAIAAGTVTFKSFLPDWAAPTYRLVRLLVIAFAVVVAYPYVPGSQSDAFKGVSLFIGVIFSLGSSSFIGNLIAGYSMTYRRAFRVGDVIKVGEHTGVVEQTRLMVTRLRTPKNEDVVVPNSRILDGDVVNYSTLARDGQLILHTAVGVGYDTPWRQVEAMLLEAADRTEAALKDPEPFVLQTQLDEFNVKYELNIYCSTPESMPRHYARLHQNILDVFNEYGVQIMTPAFEGDPARPKVVPPAEWYRAPARPSATHAPAPREEV